jgi:hypothetical protein
MPSSDASHLPSVSSSRLSLPLIPTTHSPLLLPFSLGRISLEPLLGVQLNHLLPTLSSPASTSGTNLKSCKRKWGEGDKNAARDRRRHRRQEQDPTKCIPRYGDHDPTGSVPTELNPLLDFPVTVPGYIGKQVGAIREREVWTLMELLEMGLEVFEWDGK